MTNPMNMLPNDHHPGPRCSCAECLRKYPAGYTPTSNSRLTDGELAKIIQRDAMAGATWFTGPPSFTALAAQDRRALIEDLCALRAERASLEPRASVSEICDCQGDDQGRHTESCAIWSRSAKPCAECQRLREGLQLIATDEHRLMNITARQTAESILNGKPSGVATPPPRPEPAPIPMILFCPSCTAQHVDEPDERTPGWTNPPHKSHLCHQCGAIWRPCDLPTVGVRQIETRGKADTIGWTSSTGWERLGLTKSGDAP